MEILIKKEENDKLLNRKKLELEIKHEKEPIPSRKQIIEFLCKKYNVDESKVKIKYILGKKGSATSIAKCYIHEA
ncbi:MAG: hypothetical protein RMJ17_02125 [Candidatus Aenigmarchaeota archaeon]|nr:hypothetical protein [Candidatus Aenigmarchaeota archaeon]MDW8149370.1 hypothetical protein [Candidatus Aenigmarchaeota archaeon]